MIEELTFHDTRHDITSLWIGSNAIESKSERLLCKSGMRMAFRSETLMPRNSATLVVILIAR
jgi:hypothetical protein